MNLELRVVLSLDRPKSTSLFFYSKTQCNWETRDDNHRNRPVILSARSVIIIIIIRLCLVDYVKIIAQ